MSQCTTDLRLLDDDNRKDEVGKDVRQKPLTPFQAGSTGRINQGPVRPMPFSAGALNENEHLIDDESDDQAIEYGYPVPVRGNVQSSFIIFGSVFGQAYHNLTRSHPILCASEETSCTVGRCGAPATMAEVMVAAIPSKRDSACLELWREWGYSRDVPTSNGYLSLLKR